MRSKKLNIFVILIMMLSLNINNISKLTILNEEDMVLLIHLDVKYVIRLQRMICFVYVQRVDAVLISYVLVWIQYVLNGCVQLVQILHSLHQRFSHQLYLISRIHWKQFSMNRLSIGSRLFGLKFIAFSVVIHLVFSSVQSMKEYMLILLVLVGFLESLFPIMFMRFNRFLLPSLSILFFLHSILFHISTHILPHFQLKRVASVSDRATV